MFKNVLIIIESEREKNHRNKCNSELFFQMTTEEPVTICSPIKNLNDLLDVSTPCLTNRFRSLQLIPRYTSPRQKILLCHDMKGGYLEDKYKNRFLLR